jgi:threonine synthase
MAADEARLGEWMRLACRLEGIALCPEAAACVGVLARAVGDGHIGREEKVVLFNTGAVQKYVELMKVELPTLATAEPVDWGRVASEPARPTR